MAWSVSASELTTAIVTGAEQRSTEGEQSSPRSCSIVQHEKIFTILFHHLGPTMFLLPTDPILSGGQGGFYSFCSIDE